MNRNFVDVFFKWFFAAFAFFAIIILLIITFFIFSEGVKPFLPGNAEGTISLWDFLTGLEWDPGNDKYGIGYMIVGTIYSTAIAIFVAVPIALFSSMAIVELLPKRISGIVISIIELLAGVPSVIFGIFGLGFIVPLIANIPFNSQPQGNSLLAVSIVLTIMILPTITAVSISALKSVPSKYKEASLALGATKIQTLTKVTLPAAKSGILAGVVLGVGRAIGETMAVVLVAGNVAGGLPLGVFDPIRPMTANIAVDMSYASGLHQQVLFSTALVLFVFVFILNVILQRLLKRGR